MKWKWPEAVQRWKGALGKYQAALLVAAVGAALLLIPAGSRDSPKEQAAPALEEGVDFDLEAFEKKLEKILSQVDGAGETSVVLTLDGGSRQVLARNQDRDQNGGGSNTVATVGKGSGQQEVVPLQTVAPQFRGALVVCPGGGDARVRLQIMESVSALTGLGADRIAVCASG